MELFKGQELILEEKGGLNLLENTKLISKELNPKEIAGGRFKAKATRMFLIKYLLHPAAMFVSYYLMRKYEILVELHSIFLNLAALSLMLSAYQIIDLDEEEGIYNHIARLACLLEIEKEPKLEDDVLTVVNKHGDEYFIRAGGLEERLARVDINQEYRVELKQLDDLEAELEKKAFFVFNFKGDFLGYYLEERW